MYTLLEIVTRYLILNRHLIDRQRLSRDLIAYLDRNLNFYDLHKHGGLWNQFGYYDVKTEYCHQHINREYAHRPIWRIRDDMDRFRSGDPYPYWINRPIADVPVSITGVDGFAIRTFRQHPEAVTAGFYLEWLGLGIRIHFGGSGPFNFPPLPVYTSAKPTLARSMP